MQYAVFVIREIADKKTPLSAKNAPLTGANEVVFNLGLGLSRGKSSPKREAINQARLSFG